MSASDAAKFAEYIEKVRRETACERKDVGAPAAIEADDVSLLLRLQSSDMEALSLLFNRYSQVMLAIARRVLVNGMGFDSLRTVNLPPLTNDRSPAALGSLFAGQRGLFQTLFGGLGPAIAADGSNINPVALKLLQTKLPDGRYYIPTPQRITNGLGVSTFSEPSHYSENQMIANRLPLSEPA